MEINLEKIELVKDRTGVTYREAKEALEQTSGNVVDAIVLIEDSVNEADIKPEEPKAEGSAAEKIVRTVKETVNKGNVTKIVIKKNGDTVLNLPVNAGLVGTVLFPWATVLGVVAALGTKCSIELHKDSGEIVDVSSKASEAIDTAMAKGGVVADEVKDWSSDFIDKTRDLSGDFMDAAKDKSADFMEYAKNKAGSLYKKNETENTEEPSEAEDAEKEEQTEEKKSEKDDIPPTSQFDFSDLDLSAIDDEEENKEE